MYTYMPVKGDSRALEMHPLWLDDDLTRHEKGHD